MAPTLTTEVVAGAAQVVRVAGELDLSTAARLCRAIDAAAAARWRPRVTIDLTELTFCDSTGLRALIGAVREVEVRGGRAALVLTSGGTLDRLLQLTGLDEFCVIHRVEPGRLRVDERSFVI